MTEEKKPSTDFISSYSKAQQKMIATSDNTYGTLGISRARYLERIRDYTPEKIERIITSGSLAEQQALSRNFFYKDGYYKQIIIHYATLLKYAGLLIPNPSLGKKLSTSHISKRYYNALDYVEKMNLPVFLTDCATRALIDGCYYGVIVQLDKQNFSVLDLPSGYCQTRYKDLNGDDLIEFDVSYFNSIVDLTAKEQALASYPKFIRDAYKKWQKQKSSNSWVIIPSDIGICFPFFDGRPLFLSVIPASLEYDDAIQTERDRDAEEIRKILVQKIPHLQDGRLLFEPDEAAEMHAGAVGMLKGNKNISVLTTYADVDAVVSKTTGESTSKTLEQIEKNIYAQAGVSGQIFSSTGSSTLDASIKNDIALMMYLANKFSRFITNSINRIYGNTNITFKYQILPVSIHNMDKFVDQSFKLSGSGYSYLLPVVALGLSQRDIVNLKELENDVLKLGEKLIPLSSSYTQSSDNPTGRPKLDDSEKAEKTIKNEESLDNQAGGGSN